MARWNAQLLLVEDWEQYNEEQITICQLAERVAAKLEALTFAGGSPNLLRRRDLVQEFREFAAEGNNNADEFDNILSDLYDWADLNRVWVSTI